MHRKGKIHKGKGRGRHVKVPMLSLLIILSRCILQTSFYVTSRPTQASSVWRSTHTNGCPSTALKWPRYTRGRNATKFLLTSSPSLTTPTTTCWWVRRGHWRVEGRHFNRRSLVGERREVQLSERSSKHACGMWWFGMNPLETSCFKVITPWEWGSCCVISAACDDLFREQKNIWSHYMASGESWQLFVLLVLLTENISRPLICSEGNQQ